MQTIGKLLAADEHLNHQIVDTFATVAESDLSWTEKLWMPISRKDGSLQLDVGMGRYQNRDVLDGFAGISRGKEQWTVRASRELSLDPAANRVGPITYEVLEPLKKIRWRLEQNSILPLKFDVTFDAVHPAFFEDRHIQRDERGFRIVSNVVRYHQAGAPSGWVEIDGKREVVDPKDWFAYRDHSWGVRLDVGAPPSDLRPARDFGERKFEDSKFLLNWSPLLLEKPDGTRYEYHFYLQIRGDEVFYFSGYRNHADGRQERIARARPELRYVDETRRLIGGRIFFDMLSGETAEVQIEVMGESGFYLGPALYLGFDGKKHGNWRGELNVDGEQIPDMTAPDVRKRLGSAVRDTIVRAREGDAVGYGLFEPIVLGEWPQFGTTSGTPRS
ncbi:MAG: hypothetical protein HYX63_16350 [Gammaproteobacteria bacterium]|nr:hypothetical protein [Gammaproteobacteria bacterium]